MMASPFSECFICLFLCLCLQQDLLTGAALWQQQFKAMFMKRLLTSIRHRQALVMQLIIPIAFTICALLILKLVPVNPADPSLRLDITRLGRTSAYVADLRDNKVPRTPSPFSGVSWRQRCGLPCHDSELNSGVSGETHVVGLNFELFWNDGTIWWLYACSFHCDGQDLHSSILPSQINLWCQQSWSDHSQHHRQLSQSHICC